MDGKTHLNKPNKEDKYSITEGSRITRNVNEKSDRDSEPPSEQLVDTIARYRKKLPLSTTTTNEEMVLKNILPVNIDHQIIY